MRKTAYAVLVLAIALVCNASATAPAAHADTLTRVFLNGHPVPVSFNDGDSFRVQSGEFAGRQCRLAGYNTLESFGPAHQWGSWHPYELYIIAKQATFNGRRGTWHCQTDGTADTYGRLLVHCPDLIVDQVRQGFAHAYQPDDSPSPPEYLRAQEEAIAAHRGIWAHGVPDYIMTSVHSASEDTSRPIHYNRLISTHDGHTESQQHHDSYSECEWVCSTETRADEHAVTEAARRMREDASLAPQLAHWQNVHLIEFARRYARVGELPAYVTGPERDPLEAFLRAERDAGRLGTTHQERGSCMIYVPFERRYPGRGRSVASCLRGHGTLPDDLPPGTVGGH